MFTMNFQQNINWGGQNPIMMGFYNPRHNFFLRIANAFSEIKFSPVKPMNYISPFTIGYFPPAQKISNVKPKSNPVIAKKTPAKKTAGMKMNLKGMLLKGKGKGTQYGPKFLEKVKQISKNLNCDYRDLIAIMNSESSLNAKTVARNGSSGLICFSPKYFDVAKIRKMSPIEQLDLVEKTIKNTKLSRGFAPNAKLSKGDLYALVFLPSRSRKNVLCTKGERDSSGKLLRFYESNKALDVNKNNKITKEEMAARIDNKYVSDKTFLA